MSKSERCGNCVYMQLTPNLQEDLLDVSVPMREIRESESYVCELDNAGVSDSNQCHHKPSQFVPLSDLF